MTTIERPKPYDRRLTKEGVIEAPEQTSIQERHPDWPQLDVHFHFAPHGKFDDMKGIIPYIEESDIYLFEDITANEDNKIFLNNFVATRIMPLEKIIDTHGTGNGPMRGSHNEAMVRGMYNSHSIASSIDIGKTESEKQLANEISELYHEGLPKGVDYAEALSQLKDRFAHIADLTKKREAIMANNFENEMEHL
jgi:hypothetical protein